jgi:hypothetical protein
VGQDEDAQPLVRRADFCRREQTRRRRIAHAPKLSKHGFKAKGDVAGDVFEENPFGRAFTDDAGDLGPEVTGIVGTTTIARGAERLTGVSGEDDVESTAEGLGIECPQIIPDWRRSEIPGALCGDENGSGICLPLDTGAGVIAGFGEHDAQIQASAACAEGQSVPGT